MCAGPSEVSHHSSVTEVATDSEEELVRKMEVEMVVAIKSRTWHVGICHLLVEMFAFLRLYDEVGVN